MFVLNIIFDLLPLSKYLGRERGDIYFMIFFMTPGYESSLSFSNYF